MEQMENHYMKHFFAGIGEIHFLSFLLYLSMSTGRVLLRLLRHLPPSQHPGRGGAGVRAPGAISHHALRR